MIRSHTTKKDTSERMIVHYAKAQQEKPARIKTAHQDLRVAIAGAGPLPCALARILGHTKSTHVTLLTNGEETKTFAYINATLLHRIYSFLRDSAFPDAQVTSILPRYAARIPRAVHMNRSRIHTINPKTKEVSCEHNQTIHYDVLLIADDVTNCTLTSDETPNDIYITSGEGVIALHRTLAERVARTPKREFIDVWCDASRRLGMELSVAIAKQLPEFSAQYGHPRETVHVHSEHNDAPHEEEIDALRIHLHAHPRDTLTASSSLLAHPGHIIIPPFSAGLTAVDAARDIVSYLALLPFRSVRFTSPAPVLFYIATNRAGSSGRGSLIGWATLRIRDLSRAIRAYGIWAGLHAWRGMRI